MDQTRTNQSQSKNQLPGNPVASTQLSCLHTTQLPPHNSVVVTQPQLSLHNHSCRHTTTVVPPQPTSSETKTEQELKNSKTLKTIKTFQTEKEEGEKTFSLAKNEQENQVALLQVGSQNSEVGSGATPLGKPQQGNADQERGGTPRREPQQGNADQESQNRESEVGNTEGSGGKCATQEVQNKEKISQELINKLENLKIPLDKAVRKAIADHDLSQVYGALAHIENTWESVKIPRSVFLYQLSKQAVKKAPERFSQEFFDWYSQAIASGIVEDLPPRYLSTNCYNEPLVRLKRPDPCTGAPYTLVEWRRVQLEPDYDPNPKMAFSAIQKCLEQLKQKSRKSK